MIKHLFIPDYCGELTPFGVLTVPSASRILIKAPPYFDLGDGLYTPTRNHFLACRLSCVTPEIVCETGCSVIHIQNDLAPSPSSADSLPMLPSGWYVDKKWYLPDDGWLIWWPGEATVRPLTCPLEIDYIVREEKPDEVSGSV